MENESPLVFIHYSWDSESHKKWTLFLADRLISDGVDVIFDRYDLRLGSNNNYFMEKVELADKVLLVMTPEYKIKADNRTSGVGYEYQIISTEFSKNISLNTKFIPVLREGAKESSIPLFLQSFLSLNLTDDIEFEAKYIELLKNIYDEPNIEKPSKGKKPDFKKLNGNLKVSQKIKVEGEYRKILSLGTTKKQSQKILGEPQNDEGLLETYWSHGLQLYYNRHWDKVDGILAKRQPSGISFEKEILGVRLGETFAEIKSKLGNPINWGLPDPYTSFAFYKIKGRFLTIALWRDKPEGDFIDFKMGTAYAIGYCQTHSVLACEAIVAVTIEEIRARKKPSYLEKEPNEYNIDFTANFFHENYILIPIQFGVIGGYFIGVYFKESDILVHFWLYDLLWSYLVVRAIVIRQKDNAALTHQAPDSGPLPT